MKNWKIYKEIGGHIITVKNCINLDGTNMNSHPLHMYRAYQYVHCYFGKSKFGWVWEELF